MDNALCLGVQLIQTVNFLNASFVWFSFQLSNQAKDERSEEKKTLNEMLFPLKQRKSAQWMAGCIITHVFAIIVF